MMSKIVESRNIDFFSIGTSIWAVDFCSSHWVIIRLAATNAHPITFCFSFTDVILFLNNTTLTHKTSPHVTPCLSSWYCFAHSCSLTDHWGLHRIAEFTKVKLHTVIYNQIHYLPSASYLYTTLFWPIPLNPMKIYVRLCLMWQNVKKFSGYEYFYSAPYAQTHTSWWRAFMLITGFLNFSCLSRSSRDNSSIIPESSSSCFIRSWRKLSTENCSSSSTRQSYRSDKRLRRGM